MLVNLTIVHFLVFWISSTYGFSDTKDKNHSINAPVGKSKSKRSPDFLDDLIGFVDQGVSYGLDLAETTLETALNGDIIGVASEFASGVFNTDTVQIPNAETAWSYDDGGPKSGIIFLHPYHFPDTSYCLGLPRLLGLSTTKTMVSCPKAPMRPVSDLFPLAVLASRDYTHSWFNFWKMPIRSVKAYVGDPGEDESELREAFGLVEKEIEMLIGNGIPSENIVVTGASQGGALTLYTAIHTKYKIGGFIPIIAWLPLVNEEPWYNWGTPVNKDTPIFQMNGRFDMIVPRSAGDATKRAMNQVFTYYRLENVVGNHMTTHKKPTNMRLMSCWLEENVPGMTFTDSFYC